MELNVATDSIFTITIPKVDVRRFRALAKAFGWSIEKQDAFNETTKQAIRELDNGNCETFATVDDYLKVLG